MHWSARALDTLGTTEWSAYSTCPSRSAAVVLTHGIPPPASWRLSRSRTSCALPMSKKVSIVRSCSALASRMAQKLDVDQGMRMLGAFTTNPWGVR